jgi:hypothetical protein
MEIEWESPDDKEIRPIGRSHGDSVLTKSQ